MRRTLYYLGAVVLASIVAALSLDRLREHRRGPAGCMAECPTAPSGCERTSVDPGACLDDACSKPAPMCHYAPGPDAGDVVCPGAIAGRCIPPK